MACQLSDFVGLDLSVAMTADQDRALAGHLHNANGQEDLAFAYWRPSRGARRFTAVIGELVMPDDRDRVLQGTVAFLPPFSAPGAGGNPDGCGVAFLHGHPVPGWQCMSDDDVVAERGRLAGAIAGRTGLPLVGLTRGTDGAWSGRLWLREARHAYERHWARSVRVVGRRLGITYLPGESEATATESQVATVSVWGAAAQSRLVRAKVGIVGLGSVGSLVAEALSRVGLQDLTYIDFDKIKLRNLDRTSGATRDDLELPKVWVAATATKRSSTAPSVWCGKSLKTS